MDLTPLKCGIRRVRSGYKCSGPSLNLRQPAFFPSTLSMLSQAQLLQTGHIENTVLGFGRSFYEIGVAKARFGGTQYRMESFPCKEGAC